MIIKNYPCPFDKCGKVYAAEGSLHQHLKIKHNSNIMFEERDDDD